MPKGNRGTIWFDTHRGSWRVRVFIEGTPIYRRAKSHAEALAIRQGLLLQRDRPAYERLKAGETLLDLSGLTDEQIAMIILLLESWGFPERDEVGLGEADRRDRRRPASGVQRTDTPTV